VERREFESDPGGVLVSKSVCFFEHGNGLIDFPCVFVQFRGQLQRLDVACVHLHDFLTQVVCGGDGLVVYTLPDHNKVGFGEVQHTFRIECKGLHRLALLANFSFVAGDHGSGEQGLVQFGVQLLAAAYFGVGLHLLQYLHARLPVFQVAARYQNESFIQVVYEFVFVDEFDFVQQIDCILQILVDGVHVD